MNTEIAIKVENLSKSYHIYDKPRDRLLQMLSQGRKQYFREFHALRDVSFSVSKGETVGIIGSNGAGKSTLLQLICGTLNPTHGTVKVDGRIAALLELGSGFSPDFTGRENVYMNASLLGMHKSEIDSRFNDIIAFADIGDFLDQPVKTYSSGMFARLAFSVAVHVEPSVLIVDEALSVGDMAFQEKSFTRMKQIRDSGVSILFVSHSLSAVRNFCDRAVWLDHGRLRAVGNRLTVCDEYQSHVEEKLKRENNSILNISKKKESIRPVDHGSTLNIVGVSANKETYRLGEDIDIDIKLAFHRAPEIFGIGLIIYDDKGNIVSILNSLRDDLLFNEIKENWGLTIKDNHFCPGSYSVTISIPDEHVMFSYDKWEHCIKFQVEMERSSRGFAKAEGFVRCDHEWR